jgi:FkbM family methyltransferase
MQTIIRDIPFNHYGREGFYERVGAGEWEKETFDVIDKYIEKGKVFIDCGAWAGIFSIYAYHKGAKVVAIEPDNIAFAELTENVELNGLTDKIKLLNIAISDKKGYAELNSRTADGFGNSESSLIDRGERGATQKVRTIQLHRLLRNLYIYPDDLCLIKIDIEGGEMLLLEGCKEWLIKHRPTVYISFHPAWIPPLEENIDKAIDMLFPHYDVIALGEKITPEQFKEGLLTHTHNFILKAK